MRKTIKWTSLFLAAVLLATAFVGCGTTPSAYGDSSSSAQTSSSSSNSSSSASQSTPVYEKFKIAFFGPQTGDSRQYGTALSNGAQMAVDEFNKAGGLGGKEVELVIFDDKNDPKEAVNIANLIVSNKDEYIAAMGSYSSSCLLASAPIFVENELLHFAPCGSHPDIPFQGPMVFSVTSSTKYSTPVQAQLEFETFAPERVAYLYQNTDSGVSSEAITAEYAEKYGVEFLSQPFVPGTTKDYTPILTKFKEWEPDLLDLSGTAYPDCAMILKQMQQLDFRPEYVILTGNGTKPEFLELCQDGRAEGMFAISMSPVLLEEYIDISTLSEPQQEFIRLFAEYYPDSQPDGFSAMGWDSVTILLNAAKKFGTDSAVLADEIPRMVNAGNATSMSKVEGASGSQIASGYLQYTKDKEGIKGLYVYTIEDGRFVPYEQCLFTLSDETLRELDVELYQ